jgi:hypothetical protein
MVWDILVLSLSNRMLQGARGATLDFRCIGISARQSAGAHAREQTARAESVDTLPATCRSRFAGYD